MIKEDVKIYGISENFGIIKGTVQGRMTPERLTLFQKYCSLK